MTQTVIGMFDNAVDAQHAVQKLCNNGFLREHIEVTDSGAADTSTSEVDEEGGGLSKFFKNLFSNPEDSDKYVRVARYSESIVSVQVQTTFEAESAAGILNGCGAVNVDDRASSLTRSVDVDDRATPLNYSRSERATVSDESTEKLFDNVSPTEFGKKDAESAGKTNRISITAENLKVGRPEILTNGTRVRSRIIERTSPGGSSSRDETATIHATPVAPTPSTEVNNFTPKQIVLIETAEVPVVSKVARVVEEVRVGKEVIVKTETVTDTVRRTEIDVEEIDKDAAGV